MALCEYVLIVPARPPRPASTGRGRWFGARRSGGEWAGRRHGRGGRRDGGVRGSRGTGVLEEAEQFHGEGQHQGGVLLRRHPAHGLQQPS
jgi:hypothetical protein